MEWHDLKEDSIIVSEDTEEAVVVDKEIVNVGLSPEECATADNLNAGTIDLKDTKLFELADFIQFCPLSLLLTVREGSRIR